MLSKRNIKLLNWKNQPIKQRFGLRKLSIGVASVLLGLTFMTGKNALADEQVNTDASIENVVETDDLESARQSNITLTEVNNTTAEVNNATALDSNNSAINESAKSEETPENTDTTSDHLGTVPSVEPSSQDQVLASAAAKPITASDSEVQESLGVNENQNSESTRNDLTATAEVGTVDKIHNDTILKDKYGIDINHLDAKSTLLLASLFHIFANEANLGADVNGNIAVGTLGGSIDFGTRGESIHITNGDIYYIQNLKDALNSSSFRNPEFNHVIFGQNINAEVIDGKVYVNGQQMNNLKPEEVFKDSNGTNYIDFPAVFNRLLKAADFYSSQETSAGVVMDFKDMNNQVIDISNAVATDNVIYINIPAKYLSGAQPIKIKGISSTVTGPTIVINVTGVNSGLINVSTQIHLYYDDNNTHLNNSESHEYPNHILWNFGQDTREINVSSGRFMGSILAPNAVVNAHVNIDGNIIADVVNIIGGESHRWDIHPVTPPSFIEIPEPENPQPDQGSEQDPDPKPDRPQPDQGSEQEPDPEPVRPQPDQGSEQDPDPDPEPVRPQPDQGSEQDPDRPQPDQEQDQGSNSNPDQVSVVESPTVLEKAEQLDKKVQNVKEENSIVPLSVTKTDSEFATNNNEASDNQQKLPQTGIQKNNGVLVGIITMLLTLALALGIKLKKKV